jgi:large subunit ribosomal protein L7/L12
MENAMASKLHEEMLDQIGNMSVLELADLVKALETKFGVSAASMSAGAAAPAAAAPVAAVAEEKSEYKVTLKKAGDDKIKAIKAVRQAVPELTLAQAKKAVEEVPSVLVESSAKDDAKKIKTILAEAGCEVELS